MTRLGPLLAAAVLGVAVAGSGADASPAAGDPATLEAALAVSRPLGPVARNFRLHLLLGLRNRRQGELDRILRTGEAGRWSAGSGPDPRAVRTALAAARRAGFHATWTPGDGTASLEGTAQEARRLFGVRILSHVTPAGLRFYAADREPVPPPAFRGAVVGIAGLDDFGRVVPEAITPGGVTPADILSFYDIQPLRAAGLTGAGQTIVFPELASPADTERIHSDVAAFAKTFHLPAFDLTIRNDPSWHAPAKSDPDGLAEADLDLEIVHAIAPGAKLIVYEAGSGFADLALIETVIAREQPGAIISESLGGCELGAAHSVSELKTIQAPWVHEAALNLTHFVASGDTGAYTCGQDHAAAVSFPADLPVVTAVGGTSVLLARGGGYFRELAWGNALSKSGGGGGVTRLYGRPTYQTGTGFPAGNGRLLPDVAGLADENTGWHIVTDGQSAIIGGTSAAAPLWSGLAALIDQDLRNHGLPPIGVANPAIYWIARNRGDAFHDVTAGNNLLYLAHAGWDEATGWGTPDGAKLAAAWRAYAAQHSRYPQSARRPQVTLGSVLLQTRCSCGATLRDQLIRTSHLPPPPGRARTDRRQLDSDRGDQPSPGRRG